MTITFAEAYAALKSGKSTQRKRWQRDTTMSVQNGELMQTNPQWAASSSIQLDWDDINATDWVIL